MWRAWLSENRCTQEFLLSYDLLLVSLYLLLVLYPSDSTNSCIFSKFLIQLSQEIPCRTRKHMVTGRWRQEIPLEWSNRPPARIWSQNRHLIGLQRNIKQTERGTVFFFKTFHGVCLLVDKCCQVKSTPNISISLHSSKGPTVDFHTTQYWVLLVV